MRVAAVIPALDEAASIGRVIESLPPGVAAIVVDGGSADGTVAAARERSAEVVVERRRGYGRACLSGARLARELGFDVVAFLDAGGTMDPADLPAVLEPVLRDRADLSIGIRVRGRAQPGALKPAQRLGNALACGLIWLRFGRRFADLGPMRAIRIQALRELDMREMGHGWPAEMQARAAARGLRCVEVPVRALRRRSGRSKVSGSLPGSIRAGAAILRVVMGPRP